MRFSACLQAFFMFEKLEKSTENQQGFENQHETHQLDSFTRSKCPLDFIGLFVFSDDKI